MGIFAARAANGGSDLFPVVEVGAGEGEGGEQLIEVNPAGVRVVVAQGELGFLARHGEPLDEPDPAIDARQAAAAVFQAAGDDLEGEARAAPDMPAQQGGINIGSQRVDVVEQQILQLRALRQQPRQDAIPQEIGHFIPMADGVQALERQVVRVVAGLARAAGPIDEGVAQAVAHLLLLLIEDLLRHFLPDEPQVADGGDHAQADRFAGREEQRPS